MTPRERVIRFGVIKVRVCAQNDETRCHIGATASDDTKYTACVV